MKYELEFPISSVVYVRTDLQQLEYFVTGVTIRPYGIIYLITNNGFEIPQYAFEISKERNQLLTLGLEK